MNYSTLNKEDKQTIFEIVNSTHLRLKGNQKKTLKSQFCNSWKMNKNIGAFELFMKLYQSEDVHDKNNGYFQKYIEEGFTEPSWETKTVSFRKYKRMLLANQDEIEDLEKEIEQMKEGKNFIHKDDHEKKLQETKDFFRSENSQMTNDMLKYKDMVESLQLKLKYKEDFYNKQLQTKEEIINQLSTPTPTI